MRRLLLALVAALVAMVMVASPAGAITGGQKDTQNLYPFVGLLAFYDDQGQYLHRCSGTLISPTVVLTAAHCTEGTATAYAYFQVEVPDDFRENPTGLLGTTYTTPTTTPTPWTMTWALWSSNRPCISTSTRSWRQKGSSAI
jgi:hypothetical protein